MIPAQLHGSCVSFSEELPLRRSDLDAPECGKQVPPKVPVWAFPVLSVISEFATCANPRDKTFASCTPSARTRPRLSASETPPRLETSSMPEQLHKKDTRLSTWFCRIGLTFNKKLLVQQFPLLPPACRGFLPAPRLQHLHEAVLDLHGLVDAEPRPLRAVRWWVKVVLELHRLVAAEHGLQPQHGGR